MNFASRHQSKRTLLLFLTILGCTPCFSQNRPVTNWWPDPSTGLMWTGSSFSTEKFATPYPEAQAYCSSLQLGGYSGWRLPTLDESKAAMSLQTITAWNYEDHPPYSPTTHYQYMSYLYKGQLNAHGYLWTSTQEGAKAWIVLPGSNSLSFKQQYPPSPVGVAGLKGIFTTVPTGKGKAREFNALCVRQMEPDLLALAKQAQVDHPVSDLQTLKANVPLTQAKIAFGNQDYPNSISDLQAALAIQPNLEEADFALGVSYGALNQWDQSIASFNAVLKLEKNNQSALAGLKWAKQEQKSQTTHGKVKAKPPIWTYEPS
jgi:hypothetical protein